ncbi:PREDICTED: uncharacterized protein LOC109157159 [Ipomoea nil]|uniref:uncharacterized protein LOC109157159 n=1 Tax=Ipomoea nil TaxID=35883 RepID=UPI000901B6E9|nr:PREDICTED: uncharacterized protein LOC109157159 [Ipomoea nil]
MLKKRRWKGRVNDQLKPKKGDGLVKDTPNQPPGLEVRQLLSWNCQGVASQKFHRTLKQLIRDHKPDILCLFEPRESGEHADKICFSIGFDEWARIEAFGFSGGIWVFWKDTTMVDIHFTHPQFMLLRVSHLNEQHWFLSLVYGSPDYSLRRELFATLSQDSINFHGYWLCMGDYNAVLKKDKVSKNNSFSPTRCADFGNLIFREDLTDLDFIGAKLTWCRGLESSSFKGARLDRALCNIGWKSRFPDTEIIHLPMISSDHTPLLLRTTARTNGNNVKKFRFNAM